MLIMTLAWVASVFLLAFKFGRPPETAALVSVTVFNPSFGWGFLNFLSGFPLFVLWLLILPPATMDRLPTRRVLALSVVALLLLLAHAFWFLAGILVYVVQEVVRGTRIKTILLRVTAVIPALLLAGAWFPRLSEMRRVTGFDVGAHWFVLPWERFAPSELVNNLFGMVRGPIEPMIALVLLLWGAGALATFLLGKREGTDLRLLLPAGILALVVVMAPDKYVNTISFASRWLPVAILLLLLGLPRPAVPRWLAMAIPLAVWGAFSFGHCGAWMRYEREELTGLREALAALPNEPSVMGLDFINTSRYLEGRPFLHAYAYAQVLHGGTLNFSFVEHQSGIVSTRQPRVVTWTTGLEWYPEQVRERDFGAFAYAIVQGAAEEHRFLESTGMVEAITREGRWRCYVTTSGKQAPQ